MDAEPKWRRFEKLVAKVQKELSPNAIVTHDDHIKGYESETPRQVDITVKQKIGQYDILIAIDCKDYQIPVDVKDIEEFEGLIKDIRANKGVMVAANGFTETAKLVGEKAGLNLYRLIDTEKHEWQTYVSIPVVCNFRGVKKYQFVLPETVVEFLPSTDPNDIIISDLTHKKSINLVNLFKVRWNSGELPYEPGNYNNVPITKVTTALTESGDIKNNISVNFEVISRLLFGELPLVKVRGFADEYNGHLITQGFTTDWLDVVKVEREWRQLENTSELAVKPIFELMALDLFEIPKGS